MNVHCSVETLQFKMASVSLRLLLLAAVVTVVKSDDDIKDFEFEHDADEVMIAQESRHYETIIKPPVKIVKPTGVTNSHRPQYNLDSYENVGLEDFLEPSTKKTLVKNYKSSNKIRAKEGMIKDAVLRALERKDQVGKFAQVLPIIRAMSGSQRVALASLVANQVSMPPGRAPLNLAQVRSMFGNNANTSADLMLPILLDMANLIRRAVRTGKEPREVTQPLLLPQAQLLRRSFTEESSLDDEPFDIGLEPKPAPVQSPNIPKHRIRRIIPQRTSQTYTNTNKTFKNVVDKTEHNRTDQKDSPQVKENIIFSSFTTEDNRNSTSSISATTEPMTTSLIKMKPVNISRALPDNTTLDLMADSTNQTLAQDLPVAEKLRSFNRYLDRKGNLIRRGTYSPKTSAASRRTTAEPNLGPISRRRPAPVRKLPPTSADEQTKCELFTNTLCLHADNYPTEAIVQSIRRNKAAAGALLADFRDPGEGALDGVTAAQEAKYTAEHYLVSNRRGDTANRDFAGAGEAGFMCPSTVKYARPQRARATSGQWKYIVNTGEHTQTLRLEKCLKPKESCTYLTDNFKSKCVQVYNYHRLLTWDQQNGLHMDIFKVPTCCSCHIEGYSVSFPPLGQRMHETSSEHFPGEDLSSEHGNHAFEAVQSSIQRPSVSKSPPFTHNKPLESFPPFGDNQNLISGIPFSKGKVNDNDETNLPSSNPMDSYGNTYFPDSFNQASSVRNVKRPLSARNPSVANFDSMTLPSYLEPPTPSATSSFAFVKEPPNKYKMTNNLFKRGAARPSRRPIRKKISGGPDDLASSGSSAVESFTGTNSETIEDFSDYLEEPEIGQASVINAPKTRITISPKLQAVTTEKVATASKSHEKSNNIASENFTSNGKRINYNYHPIIDFFGAEDKEIIEDSIDREDSQQSFVAPLESEWKPINHPPSRNIQSNNLVGRKKHK